MGRKRRQMMQRIEQQTARKLDRETVRKRLTQSALRNVSCGKTGGIAEAVVQNGEMYFLGCFDDERLGIHVDETTIFRLASMTKPVTAVAVLQLLERGELSLEDPVYQYIPAYEHLNIGRINGEELEVIGPAKKHITIRHLLTHTSGLGSGPVGHWVDKQFPRSEHYTLEQTVERYAEYPLDFEPYSKQVYSGSHAFDVLARIVEIVSGMRFGDYLNQEIFDPLGMPDTVFAPTMEQWARMIPVHDYRDGKGCFADYPSGGVFLGLPVTCCAGGTALASTLKDYVRFAEMLQNRGCLDGVRIIGEKMIREMSRQQLPPELMNGVRNWGLGVRVVTDDPANTLPCGAFGWSGALGGHFWVDPVNRITAVYLKNSLYDGGSWSKTGQEFERDVYSSFSNKLL